MTTEIICRVLVACTIVIGVSIGLPPRRRADRVGGKIPRSVDGPIIPIALALTAAPAMLSVLLFVLYPAWVRWSMIELPPAVRLTGVLPAAAALLIIRHVFAHLGLNVTVTSAVRKNATLVTTGPYRWVRHPMYAGGVGLMVAYGLLTSSWFVALGGLMALGVVAFRTRREEANLVSKFGDEYRSYQARTGRFLPRLRSYSSSST